MHDAGALSVKNLHVRFGLIKVIRDVSFSVPSRRALAIVGDNGAGKSTILLGIAGGLLGADVRGVIEVGARAFSICSDVVERRSAGVSIVPEREKVFSLLTVNENLRCASGSGSVNAIKPDDVFAFFPRLAERRRTLAGNLSGGEQQMLAIGMALLGNPCILLIDEPTLGLSVPVIENLCETLSDIRKNLSLTLLIAESETQWIHYLADESVTLERGVLVDNTGGGGPWHSSGGGLASLSSATPAH